MIFVDSNVPMYLIGRDHPNKDAALRVLGELVRAGETLVTDVEVFQEILHRYVALRRREFIRPAFTVLNELADAVLGIERHHVDRAADIVLASDRLDARDALHIAVMEAHDVSRILTFDRAFELWPGLTRLG